MNKTKIILILIGAVSVVAALALGWFAWSSWSETGERSDDLEGAFASAERLAGLKVRPCAESVKALEANENSYRGWTEKARAAASVGDVAYEPTTPPAFKSKMVDEAKRLADLPGGVDGKLVAQDFAFGFSEFISGGQLPSAGDLPRLQREWHDVVRIVEALAASGVASVNEITLNRTPVEQKAEPARKGKKVKKAVDEAAFVRPVATRMSVEFRTPPEGIVASLNAFTTNRSFIVVESFDFVREKDEIGEKLGGSKKADEQAKGGRKGGRKRGAAAALAAVLAAQTEEEKEFTGGVITDPQNPGNLKVTMRVAVYDFQSAGKTAEGAVESARAEAADSEEEE